MTRSVIAQARAGNLAGTAAIVVPLLVSTVDSPTWIAAGLVGLAMVLAASLGPANAAGAVVGLLPLVFVTTRVGSTEWGVLELALICCGVACLVELAWRLVAQRDKLELRALLSPLDVTILAVAILVLGIVSLTWIADPRAIDGSQRELRRVIAEPLVIVLAVRLSNRDHLKRLVTWSLAVSGLIVAIIALVQVGQRSSGVEVGSVFRPIGTYPHPNNLALYLERVVWVPLALAIPGPWGRITAASAATLAIACAATLSRGAVGALVVGGVTWLLLTHRRPTPRMLIAGSVLVIGILIAGRAGSDRTESLDLRGQIWSATAAMIGDYPLTGIGIDQFYALYGTRYVDPAGWAERYTSHPHNLVLDFWLQLGVGGLLLLGGLLWALARRAQTIHREPRELLAAALVAGLAGGMAHGLIDNGFFLPDLATFLWLTLAVIPLGATGTRRA